MSGPDATLDGVATTAIGPDAGDSRAAATTQPRKAVAPDLPVLARTLAAAFFDDPVFTWWIPDRDRRREVELGFFEVVIEASVAHEQIYTTEDVVAGAIWVPPGVDDDGDRLAAELGEVSGEYAPTLFEVFAMMEEQHPREQHYYLFFLGTRPEWQSRGIGSALMGPVLERCDRARLPAYLEATSERNRRLYARHGFEVVGEIRLPDGPSMWPMWRQPA